jgi:hypothetical protein
MPSGALSDGINHVRQIPDIEMLLVFIEFQKN